MYIFILTKLSESTIVLSTARGKGKSKGFKAKSTPELGCSKKDKGKIMITLKGISSGRRPLYMCYSGQSFPQPAWIELNCEDEILSADFSGDNLTPSRVYNSLALRWKVDPEIPRRKLSYLMELIAPLAEDVLAGYDKKWNGQNIIGIFDDDAVKAIDRIRYLCHEAMELDVPQRAGRPRNATPRRKMSISLPEPKAAELAAYAELHGMTISSVIEQAITDVVAPAGK